MTKFVQVGYKERKANDINEVVMIQQNINYYIGGQYKSGAEQYQRNNKCMKRKENDLLWMQKKKVKEKEKTKNKKVKQV